MKSLDAAFHFCRNFFFFIFLAHHCSINLNYLLEIFKDRKLTFNQIFIADVVLPVFEQGSVKGKCQYSYEI